MPNDFVRPSLGDLWNRIGALWRATYPGADTNLRNSPDRAWVGVIARSTDEDLSFLDWMVDQLFPFSATRSYLERWAAFKDVQRKPAAAGVGTIAFVGAVPDSVAMAGTQLQTPNGVRVALSQDCVVAGDGTATAVATAVAGGIAGNVGPGVVMTFVGTPAGFPDTGTVAGAFAGGAEAETDPLLRLRTQRRYAQPSFGGSQNDWQNAALAVPGVTRVFTSPATPTPGAVTVWPLFDGIRINGIPIGTNAWFRPGTGPSAGIAGTGDQRLVLDTLLTGAGGAQRPVCSHVYVTAAATQALNLTIGGLDPSTPAVKAAIATEIARMLTAKLAQIDAQRRGVGVLSGGYTIEIEWISAAINQAAGVRKFDLTVPMSDVVVPAGTILVPGVNTYV